MLFTAKLSNSPSEIHDVDYNGLRSWVMLISPSAIEMIDWEKVQTGAKVQTKLSDDHAIVIVSDTPPKKLTAKVEDPDDGEEQKTPPEEKTKETQKK